MTASPAAAPPAPPLVALRGVDKLYSNGVLALQGFDLAVGQGEFVSLLGPSGCGKSTALRLIAGLGDLSAGAITWSNRGGTAAGARGEIGFVFQEPTLMPWATVSRNIQLPLTLQNVPAAEARDRVEEAVRQVGLEGFQEAYPRELSGGMRMRVSIARALITRPRILLMDEPFASLDEITRIRLNNDLLHLWETHRWTVVFVTHSVYESVYLSSRISVMSARPGRVTTDVAIGAPYPRDESYRTSTVYNEYCRVVSARLAETLRA